MKGFKKKVLSLMLVMTFIMSLFMGSGKVKANASDIDLYKLKDAFKQRIYEKYTQQSIKLKEQNKLTDKLKGTNGNDVKNVSATKDPNEVVRIIVQLDGKAAIEGDAKGLAASDTSDEKRIDNSIKKVQASQTDVIKKVEAITGNKNRRSYGYLLNGFSIQGKRSDIQKIRSVSGVKSATEAKAYYPDLKFAKELTQTYGVWQDLGYKGEGMVVSIIDTGVDYTHKDLTITDSDKVKIKTAPANGPGKFYSIKVPYGYNFADGNYEIADKNPLTEMHGMHVAGIVAANGKDSDIDTLNAVKGVAPEAQLLAMKVFSNNPGSESAYDDDIVAAIEDSVLHGADIINMSLGSSAGFQDENDPTQIAIKNATDNGTVVVISAGNSALSTTDSGWDIPQYNYLNGVDTATVGNPGTSKDAITVASYENTDITGTGFNYTSDIENSKKALVYSTSEVDPLTVLTDAAGYELVDCGQGKNYIEDEKGNDFDPSKVAGKIALVQKVTGSFGNKKVAAQAAGAIGVVFYNGEGDDSIPNTAPKAGVTIPCINVSYTSGAKLKSLIEHNLKVQFKGEKSNVANPGTQDMSAFTSWGPGPGLEFKPEISAPGGNIYSLANGNKYQTMSGTSMAAPHVAGSEALIVEAIKANNPGITGRALVELAKNTTINTAKIEYDKYADNVPYSPRRQGAGLIQIEDAIKNKVTVTDNSGNAAVALKELDEKETFELNLNNYGTSEAVYDLANAGILTEVTDQDSGEVHDSKIDGAKVSFDKNKVTVPANGQAKVAVTIELPSNFSAGQYVEGYIKFNAKGIPSLTVPYIGFYGNWSELQTIDKPQWENDSMLGATSLGGFNEEGLFVPYGLTDEEGTINPDTIAFSNGESGAVGNIIPNMYMLRNAKDLNVEVLDSSKNVIRVLSDEHNIRKNILEDELAKSVYVYGTTDTQGKWDGTLYNNTSGKYEAAPEGQYYIRIRTKTDIADSVEQTVDMPVKVDATAPEVNIISSEMSDDGTYTLKWKVKDDFSGNSQQFLILVNGNFLDDEEYENIQNEGNDTYSLSIKLEQDKANEIAVAALDNATNIGLAVTYVKTGHLPAVELYGLEDNMYSASKNINVEGYVQQDVKKLTINNAEVEIQDEGYFKYAVSLNEGENTVSVAAKDDKDNIIFSKDYNVSVDTKAPDIAITAIDPKASDDGLIYTKKDYVDITGKVTDANPFELTINGDEVDVDEQGNFTAKVDVYGNTLVSMVAQDNHGNYTEKKYTVISTIDSDSFMVHFDNLDTFMVLSPKDTVNDELTVSGQVNHGTMVFKIDDKPVTINKDLTFSTKVKLSQGNNIVKIYAEDNSGNIVYNYSCKVLYDSVAPKLTVTEPATKEDGKAYTNKDSITVKGEVSDNTFGYSLYINGNAVLTTDRYPSTGNDINKKQYEYETALNDGSNIITMELYDEFGNVTKNTFEAVKDKTAPKPPVFTPSTTELTNKDVMVAIAAASTDKDIEKVEYSFDNNVYLVYTDAVKVTDNSTLYAKVTDYAGNTTVSSIKITNIDKTAPVVSISAVENQKVYNTDITPIITVDDSSAEVAKTLNDKPYSGDKITAEGAYTLKVKAEDNAGNVTEAQVSFTIDKTAPEIKFNNLEEGKSYKNLKLVPDISTSEAATVTLLLDEKAYDGKTPIVALGEHVLKATAVDNAGNKAVKEVHFKLELETTTDNKDFLDHLKDIIDSNGSAGSVLIDSNKNPVIGEDTFSAVKGKDVTLQFEVASDLGPVIWSFNGKDVSNTETPVNLTLNPSAPNKDAIGKLDSNAEIISFKFEGTLPAPMTISIPIDTSKFDITKPIYFYHYNPTTKTVEKIGDGLKAYKRGDLYYVDVTITHCSDYFLSANGSVKVTGGSGLVQTGSMIDDKVLIGLGGILILFGVFALRRPRKKSDDIA